MDEFQREERYIVIKRKHLSPVNEARVRETLAGCGAPTIGCVIVEADWPNYEDTWKAIEQVAAGMYEPGEKEKLQSELTAARDEAERLRGRIAELSEKADRLSFAIVHSLTDDQQESFTRQFAELQDAIVANSSEPWLLRKQAEAVNFLIRDLRSDNPPSEIRDNLLDSMKLRVDSLRQQADEAEK